jgi:hypothetical protein
MATELRSLEVAESTLIDSCSQSKSTETRESITSALDLRERRKRWRIQRPSETYIVPFAKSLLP